MDSYVIICEQYHVHTTIMIQQLERMKEEVIKYAKKEDANIKSVAIRKEIVENITKYVNITDELFDVQETYLKDTKRVMAQYKMMKKDHEILKLYAASKGCDLSLLPFLNEKDFK